MWEFVFYKCEMRCFLFVCIYNIIVRIRIRRVDKCKFVSFINVFIELKLIKMKKVNFSSNEGNSS